MIDPKKVELTFQGKKLTGFLDPVVSMDYGVPFSSFLVDEERHRAALAERVRAEHRQKALVNLWTHALSALDINHPDPRVRVERSVGPHLTDRGKVVILFRMYNLRDSNYPDKLAHHGFQTFAYVNDWPGLYCAQVYLSGMWTVYMMHEAQELVVHKEGIGKGYYMNNERRYARVPVVDPHDTKGYNQRIMQEFEMVDMMRWALGPEDAKTVLANAKPGAAAELDHEIDHVAGTHGRWE